MPGVSEKAPPPDWMENGCPGEPTLPEITPPEAVSVNGCVSTNLGSFAKVSDLGVTDRTVLIFDAAASCPNTPDGKTRTSEKTMIQTGSLLRLSFVVTR